MPNFAANLTMMFNEVDFLDRFAAAANFGFKGVEYLFPYDYEPAQLFEKLEQHGLAQVLHNLPAGDWAAGERGIACHPDRVGEFQEGVGKAIEYATALNCPQVNCLAGLAQDGVSDEDKDATIISNLKVCRRAPRSGGHPATHRAYQHNRHSRVRAQLSGAGARPHRARGFR